VCVCPCARNETPTLARGHHKRCSVSSTTACATNSPWPTPNGIRNASSTNLANGTLPPLVFSTKHRPPPTTQLDNAASCQKQGHRLPAEDFHSRMAGCGDGRPPQLHPLQLMYNRPTHLHRPASGCFLTPSPTHQTLTDGYDATVDPRIENFFCSVALRYGHSQVSCVVCAVCVVCVVCVACVTCD